MSVRTTATVVVGTAPTGAVAWGPQPTSAAAVSAVAASRRRLAMGHAYAAGGIERFARVPGSLDPVPDRTRLLAGVEIRWQGKVAVRVWVRPVGQALGAHTLRELDLHRDVDRCRAVPNGGRKPVIDGLAGLLGRLRGRADVPRKMGLALRVDRRVGQGRVAMRSGTDHQLVPDLSRRLGL